MKYDTNGVLKRLKQKYKDDTEALEEIKRAEETIKYYEDQGRTDRAEAHCNNLEAFLNDWY